MRVGGDAGMPDERDTSLARSLQSLHENIRRAGPAATASYSLIGALLLLGGAGVLVDRWQGTAPWGVLAGMALGLVVGFYQLAMVMWRR